MTVDTAQRRRLVVVAGMRRFDIAVPASSLVSEVLAAVGLRTQAGRDAVLRSDGREIDPSSTVEGLRDGTVVVVVDLAERAGRTARVARRREARPTAALWWFLAGAGALLATLVLTAPFAVDATLRQSAGVAAAAAALLSGVVTAARTPRRGSPPAGAVIGILLLAFGGAAAVTPLVPAAGVLVTVFAALMYAAAVAGTMGVVTRSNVLGAEVRAAMVMLLVLAAVWGAALLLHLDVVAAAAATLGIAPVAHRVLVASLVDVAPGAFVDYGRFQTTRWTVRQQIPDEVLSIDADDAGALVARSTARLTSGTFVLVAAVAASAPAAFPAFTTEDPLVLAGRIALGAALVLAFMLGARKSTVPASRWMLRIGAAAALAAVVRAGIPLVDAGALSLIAGLLLLVAAGVALLVIPASRGAGSLAWSRAGDVFEWIAIALSLPAGLLAADVVDAVRGMMAA